MVGAAATLDEARVTAFPRAPIGRHIDPEPQTTHGRSSDHLVRPTPRFEGAKHAQELALDWPTKGGSMPNMSTDNRLTRVRAVTTTSDERSDVHLNSNSRDRRAVEAFAAHDGPELHFAKEAVEKLLADEARHPLIVSVMGQTGVGKSTLANAIFGTDLETGAVRPTTKQLQEIRTDHDGHELRFYDLPGLGEGSSEDQAYVDLYRDTLDRSDIVIWAVHADSRSVSFDRHALEQLLDSQPPSAAAELFSKISFVLTKADLATTEPWILGLLPDAQAKFAPRAQGAALLGQKAEYFRDALIEPFAHLMSAHTYNDAGFDLSLPSFRSDQDVVTYEGAMSQATLDNLRGDYPQFEAIFNRLWHNYEVIPCSARYRFNLVKVMLLILNRLGPLALGRFRQFLNVDNLDQLPFAVAKTYRNFLVVDPHAGRVVADIASDL